ncbi:MAG: S-methyl-5'-thioadenosine phosphorylase [Candidatus Bathyarchaeia archaeon]
MRKAEIAIIGGTGLEELIKEGEKLRVGTPYGPSPQITIGKIGNWNVAFLPRHGTMHEIPPHKINFRANIWSLKSLGINRIIATNAVGAINENFKPGDFVIPVDVIDFTKFRSFTFYDEAPVTHIDLTEPYCPIISKLLMSFAKKHSERVFTNAVLVCTEGPRYETPAEIKMFRILGCDIVGMTGTPELFLARELEICYATICFVSNMAAGLQKRLTIEEVKAIADKVAPKLKKILFDAILNMPKERNCSCGFALEKAKIT